jgi:hypothetical protein
VWVLSISRTQDGTRSRPVVLSVNHSRYGDVAEAVS